MNKPLVFTAGLFVGAALLVSARTLMVNDSPPVERVSADADVLKSAQKVLDRDKILRAELDQREAYVEKAENKLGLASPAGVDAAAAKAKDEKSKMMSTIMSSVMKSQMDMKLAALKSRLNLSPDQEKAIQDVMDKQEQVAQSMAEKVMNGASEDEMKQAAKAAKDQGGDALDLDKQLKGILSPDQQAEYANMQADDKKNQNETMANLELSTIQGSLQLSDDQKDKVFNVLMQTGAGATDEAKKAAMQSVLTPQQLDTYSKYLDSRSAMVKSFVIEKDVTTDSSTPAPPNNFKPESAMNKITLFVTGIIAGVALAAGGEAYFAQTMSAPSAAKPGILKAAETALAKDQDRDAQITQREAAVKAKLAELGPKAPDLNAPDMKTRMANMMSAAMKQRVELKMGALKSRLNLTDDEEQSIRDILSKEADFEAGMGQKMMTGQLSQADLKKTVADQKSRQAAVDQQIQNVLTPAQYIEYQNSQNDDKKNQAQMQANAEMAQVQSSLQLSDDQKDKVFTALYSGFAQQAGADGAKPAFDDLDIDGQMEAKKAAMQAVLTPDQFNTYSKFVDSQKQMYQAIIGGAASH